MNINIIWSGSTIIRSIAIRYPKLSSSQIAEIINREYITVLFAMGQVRRAEQNGIMPVRVRNDVPKPNAQKDRVIVLRLQGFGFDEIAAIVGIPKQDCWNAMDRYRRRMARERKATDALKRAA